MKKIILMVVVFLLFSGVTFPEKVAVLTKVLQADDFNILGDQAYITEGTTFYIYSLDRFKLIKKFGIKGEGPSEFRFKPRLIPTGSHLMIQDVGKLCVFLPDGTYVEEFRIPHTIRSVFTIGKNLVGEEVVVDRKNKKVTRTIKLYNRDFKTLSEIATGEGQGAFSATGNEWKAIDDLLKHFVYGDRIYIADSRKGFFFEIFDSNGKKLYEINHPYQKRKVTDDHKEKILQRFKRSPRWEKLKRQNVYVFPDYFPAFVKVLIDDWKIYVFTYEKKDNKNELIVMDLKGKILKRTFFERPRGPYSIRDSWWYYLVENEETENWEVHRKKIE